MSKEKLPTKGRIIIVTTCQSCPHHTIEETNKKEYTYCWAIMKTIDNLQSVLPDCPLEEIEFEWEDETDD